MIPLLILDDADDSDATTADDDDQDTMHIIFLNYGLHLLQWYISTNKLAAVGV